MQAACNRPGKCLRTTLCSISECCAVYSRQRERLLNHPSDVQAGSGFQSLVTTFLLVLEPRCRRDTRPPEDPRCGGKATTPICHRTTVRLYRTYHISETVPQRRRLSAITPLQRVPDIDRRVRIASETWRPCPGPGSYSTVRTGRVIGLVAHESYDDRGFSLAKSCRARLVFPTHIRGMGPQVTS